MAGEPAAAAREPITVGTFCSGTDAPIFALRQAGIPHRHVFSAETNKHARTFIQANCPPETMYDDIMSLDLATVPRVDLFVAGPPCQPFSGMNRKNSVRHTPSPATNMDPRVAVLRRCLEYIKAQQPKVAIIENVVALAKYWRVVPTVKEPREDDHSSFSATWNREMHPLIEDLHNSYDISAQVLNPVHYDCPQNRPRVYVMLVEKSLSPISFPPRVPLTRSYSDFLEDHSVSHDDTLSYFCQTLIDRAHTKFGPSWRPGIISQNTLPLQMRDHCIPLQPFARCLIANQRSFVYDHTRKRFLTNREAFRLQGFTEPITFPATLTRAQLHRLAGNAMNVTVLEHLLLHVLVY